jgi:hypothetical protein
MKTKYLYEKKTWLSKEQGDCSYMAANVEKWTERATSSGGADSLFGNIQLSDGYKYADIDLHVTAKNKKKKLKMLETMIDMLNETHYTIEENI